MITNMYFHYNIFLSIMDIVRDYIELRKRGIPIDVNYALEFATKKHQGRYRKHTGEAYIWHLTRVATYVEQFKTSNHLDLLKACTYLHDTLEDTDTIYYELVDQFGLQVAGIVL